MSRLPASKLKRKAHRKALRESENNPKKIKRCDLCGQPIPFGYCFSHSNYDKEKKLKKMKWVKAFRKAFKSK